MDSDIKVVILLFLGLGLLSGSAFIITTYNDQLNKDKFLHCLELGQNKDVCKEILSKE